MAALINQLDHDEFTTREAATAELSAMGPAILPALHEHRAKFDDNPEGHKRVDILIKALTAREQRRTRSLPPIHSSSRCAPGCAVD